jgi:hypothetical protein
MFFGSPDHDMSRSEQYMAYKELVCIGNFWQRLGLKACIV